MAPTQPRTMPHEFTNPVLKKHFLKSPIPAGAIRLIDIPPDVFLDTEEEVNVIAASLWIMSILYDKLPEKEVPKTKEDLRKWVTRTRIPVIAKMADKVEPPFTAWSMDQMQRDVFAMMEELLLPFLPPEDKSVSGPIKK